MNCGSATMTFCVLQKLSSDGPRSYRYGLPLQYTTRISDGFAARASRTKPFSSPNFHLLWHSMRNVCLL